LPGFHIPELSSDRTCSGHAKIDKNDPYRKSRLLTEDLGG